MTDLNEKDRDLLSAIDAYAAESYGSDQDGGVLSTERSLALDAYQGKNIEPADKGRSQVVDWTVFETTQWIMPSMMRIYAGGSNVVEFDPTGPEDEDGSKQESEYLNYLVMQKNDWDLIARTWMQDAMITKNAYCRAFMEEKLEPETIRYEGQTPEQVALLLQDRDLEVIGQDQRIDENADPKQATNPNTGEPVFNDFGEPVMEPQVLFDIEVRRVKAKQRLQFQVLPPERCKIGKDTPDFTLNKANYFEYSDLEAISELRKQGYDIDDDISDTPWSESDEDRARDDRLELTRETDLPDPSMRQVNTRYIWIRHDEDGDGIAELLEIVLVGQTVLDKKMVSMIPVSSIVPFINTHRHIGSSVADLVFDIQRIKTFLLRNGLDSVGFTLSPRNVVSDKVNLDDLLVVRQNGAIRLHDGAIPAEGHVQPLTSEFVFPAAQEGLRHMDTVIESHVGVNKMFQGIDESNLNDHNRIGQLSSMAAQRVEDIARIFAPGFQRLFSIAHKLVLESGHRDKAIKLRGQWVDINPEHASTDRDMRIVAPFAAGNKDNLLQRLMIIGQIQEKMLAGGLPTVDVEDVYNLALDISQAADAPGDRYFTDPATVPPPEPKPDPTMIALEIENKKADNQAADSQTDADLGKYKADLDAQIDKYRADLQAETQIALAELTSGQSVELEKLKTDLKANPIEVNGERVSASAAFKATQDSNERTAKALEDAMTRFTQAAETLNRPMRVIRDESGAVTGAEPA